MPQSFVKDVEAELDYSIDWSDWLGIDTIGTSTWVADSGITVESDSNTTTVATVWLSGGTVNTYYRVTNTIVTAAGRTDERSIYVQAVEL